MASQGPNSGGSAANDTTNSTLTWSGISNALSSDNFRASRTLNTGDTLSAYLKITSFGFSLPTGSTIDGIVSEFEAQSSTANKSNWADIRLVKAGTVVGSNLSSGATLTASDVYYSFGSSTELWGTTWTEAEIESTGFGTAAAIGGPGTGNNGLIDHVRITVYYTLPLSPPFKSGSLSIPISICVR